MTTRTIDKLRAVGLALGSAMAAHQLAERAEHQRRVRRAILRSRPSR